jgi:hypothetical protein
MARIVKPLFRSRHHRKQPKWNLGEPPRSWRQRIDWLLILLVVIVFVVSFGWLFQGGNSGRYPHRRALRLRGDPRPPWVREGGTVSV